jgi:pyruvate/2-oxoglutarate dehydrogenase complex dihydrolipoamide dehydrogenase (E3) component
VLQDGGMSEQQCDVVVVGMGPGGEALAARLAKAGLSVVAVEAELVGGECPYWGCIPSKMLIRAANALAEARRVDRVAGHAEVTPDFTPVAKRVREEATDDWDDTVAADRLADAGIRLVRGHGRLAGDRVVEVETADGVERLVAARGVVLNTGTTPTVPPIDGLADTPYWTNREAVAATAAPESLVVIGGGAIGLELAQAFSRFGSDVAVLEVAPRILGPEEPESSELLTDVLQAEGMGIHAGISIDGVAHDGERFHVTCGDVTFEAEQLLVAAGRTSRLQDIGLDTVGVDDPGRFLEVDDDQLVQDGLWAIGDIVGRGAFTHVAMYQSERAARAILGEHQEPYDTSLPRVTFTDPEVGGVGLTEQQARDKGIAVEVATSSVASSARGFVHGVGNEGLIKLVIDTDRDVLVGATSVGPTGGETLAGLAVAVRAEVSLSTLRNSIYAYPTYWRAVESTLPDATPA